MLRVGYGTGWFLDAGITQQQNGCERVCVGAKVWAGERLRVFVMGYLVWRSGFQGLLLNFCPFINKNVVANS